VPSLDQISDGVCEASGADFAFILTRKGRLATRNAPENMPLSGRQQLVAMAERLLGAGGIAHQPMPREALVPYGGAAPVDVYVAARAEAILCVVLATYSAQHEVGPALVAGLDELDALMETEASKRSRRRGRQTKAPPPPKSSKGRRTSMPPPLPSTTEPAAMAGTGRDTFPFLQPAPKQRRTSRPAPPEITVGEATIGRATLAAIQVDAEAPEITYGVAKIGRGTLVEIERSLVPNGDARSSTPILQIGLESMPDIDVRQLDALDRQTRPFTELATDGKRAYDARERVRVGAPPDIIMPPGSFVGAPVDTEEPTTIAVSPQRTVIVGRSMPSNAGRSSRHSIPDAAIGEPDTIVNGPSTLRDPTLDGPTLDDATVERPMVDDSPTVPRSSVRPTAPIATSERAVARGLRDSGIEEWHQALNALVGPTPSAVPRPSKVPRKAPRR
jgi:hypothetical protein